MICCIMTHHNVKFISSEQLLTSDFLSHKPREEMLLVGTCDPTISSLHWDHRS